MIVRQLLFHSSVQRLCGCGKCYNRYWREALEKLLLDTHAIPFTCSLFYFQGPAHQALLCNMGAVTALLPLLVCDIPKIQHPALQCYAAMSFQNGAVSLAMKSGIDYRTCVVFRA